MTRAEVITGVLQREGWPAVTDKPSDRGGLTKGGVTWLNYNRWLQKQGRPLVSREDFPALTEGDAREFYFDQFLRPFEFVARDSEALFVMLADWAVMSGPDDPARGLQRVLARLGQYRGKVDGVPGPQTMTAWGRATGGEPLFVEGIRKALVAERILAHATSALDAPARALMEVHPETQLHNLRGWLRRATEFI